MFENFKIYDDVELPDYAEYCDEDSEGIFVSVLTDNLSSFYDWVDIMDIKIEKV